MAEKYDDSDKNDKKVKIFGFGTFGLSVLIALCCYLYAWWFVVGVTWNWYMFLSLLVIFALQLVFTFVLKSYAAWVQTGLFVAFVINMILVFWFATYQTLVGINLNEFIHELNKWPSENKIYVCMGQTKQAGTGTEKTLNNMDSIRKIFDTKFDENKEGKKTGVGETFAHVEIDIADVKSAKDAEELFKFIRNYPFTSKMKRAFVNITAPGLVKASEGKVMTLEDFVKLQKDKTGIDHIKKN